MKASPFRVGILVLISVSLPACKHEVEEVHHEPHKVLATSPVSKDVITTKTYVCQIHSYKHTEIRAMEKGYLEAITVKEGQTVKKGDPLFKVVPILYQAKLDAEMAEAQLAQLEYNNTKKLAADKVVSQNEVLLLGAKLAKAQAKVKLANAELQFASVVAPFDGIIDRQQHQEGALIAEGDMLTTVSDNRVMWVYFNVPEADYLEYMERKKETKDEEMEVELVLAGGRKFPHRGRIAAIEADFNRENGNIAFRADFPNPEGLLRNGQTGNVLLNRVVKDAIVIPQQATFEILDKRYVYVVGEDKVARQRGIVIEKEMDDIFVLKSGVEVGEKMILEGIRQIRDGDEVEFEFREPLAVLDKLKNKAE